MPPKAGATDRAVAAAAEETTLQLAINAGDVQAVARLVVAGTSTKLRQSAAQAIDDPDMLRQLIRDVRGGNDKSVYKILTSKRDALLEQARKLEQLQAEINAASAALERHSQRAYDALYRLRLEQFERRWEAVAAQADNELRGRVQQWIDRCRETVSEHLREVEAKASRELAAANAVAEEQRLRQEQLLASAAAATEQERIFDEQQRALAAEPPSESSAGQVAEQQPERQAVREIGILIRKARAALSDGGTSRAAAARRAIDEKLAAASPLPAKLAGQLQQLDQQLDELKDWKSFSVAPKRAELIEEMESLIGATLEPQALADEIKRLQDEWRTLGKGAGEPLEADGQRFLEAAKKAYEPCIEYFAAQALIREENLRRREALLASLAAFEAEHDWERADWRAVIKALQDTKQAWRGCSPVDHKAARPQQKRFDTLTASLRGRLEAEYANNVKQKESLIERARQLLAGDDIRKAIDAVKALQQQWRAVGPVPRDTDQRLWEVFRQHCDAVFQKRAQDLATYTASLESNKAQAIALCEQLESIALLEGPELLQRAGERVELRRAFAAIGEFPRADARVLQSRFDQALERCEAVIARQRVRDAERGWSDLFEAADQVRAYRLAVARGLDAAQLDTLKAAAEITFSAARQWPKGGLEALQQGLAGERSEDLAANEAALRLLCVRAEILADMPTPPEDQALRREYQLQRLVQSMGQGVRVGESQLDTLAIEWVGVGPVEPSAYQPLWQRFLRCREPRS
jgi:hypothetical protein